MSTSPTEAISPHIPTDSEDDYENEEVEMEEHHETDQKKLEDLNNNLQPAQINSAEKGFFLSRRLSGLPIFGYGNDKALVLDAESEEALLRLISKFPRPPDDTLDIAAAPEVTTGNSPRSSSGWMSFKGIAERLNPFVKSSN